jgi:hypothetical protein
MLQEYLVGKRYYPTIMTHVRFPAFECGRFPRLSAACLSFAFFFTGCKTSRPSAYLQTISRALSITGLENDNSQCRIQSGDKPVNMVTNLHTFKDAVVNEAAFADFRSALNGFTIFPNWARVLHRQGGILVPASPTGNLQQNLDVFVSS